MAAAIMNVVAVRAAARSGTSSARRAVALRAEPAEQASAEPTAATVYFTAKNGARVSGSDEQVRSKARNSSVAPHSFSPLTHCFPQYSTAVASGDIYKASSVTGVPSPLDGSALSLGDAMAFAGPAPELINGRLAMLAFVAAAAAEVSSGESMLRQLADQPTLIVLSAVLVAVGSLVPLTGGGKDTKSPLGFLTASAEMINGRAAMLGLVALGCTEALRGGAALF